MPNSAEQFLQHVGVKGMRWGHRKARETSGDSSGSPQPKRKGLSRNQKLAIAGVVAVGVTVGALLLAKHKGLTLRDIKDLAAKGKAFVDKLPGTKITESSTPVSNIARKVVSSNSPIPVRDPYALPPGFSYPKSFAKVYDYR